jgi:hypothetical protein
VNQRAFIAIIFCLLINSGWEVNAFQQELDSLLGDVLEEEVALPDSLKEGQVLLENPDSLKYYFEKGLPGDAGIEQSNLDRYLNDRKYDYSQEPGSRSWWDRFRNWINYQLGRFFNWLFGEEKAGAYLATFFRILPYLFIAIIIFLIARFFLKVDKRQFANNAGSKNLVALSEEERIMQEEDIQALIAEALAAQDYRLAVRYQFILCLKLLKEGEWIQWQPQKTNRDYVQELENPELQSLLQQAVRVYDYIWYGEFPLNESGYQKVLQDYHELQKKIQAR